MSTDDKPRAFEVYRPVIDTAVFVLGLIGILVVVHLWIQAGRGFDRGCFGFSETAATVECEAVTQSDAGTMFGVSNILWGLVFYLGLTALSFATVVVSRIQIAKVKKLRAALIGVGFLYSLYLVYIQTAQIGEYCKLCLISAGIVAVLFILQLIDMRTGATDGERPVAETAGRWKMFSALAAATVVVGAADVAYFSSLPPAPVAEQAAVSASPPAVPTGDPAVGDCFYDTDLPTVENYRDLVSFSDPSLGNPDASVTVIEFFDPNCPHCATLHPIMMRAVAEHGDKAWFVWRPFVLWQRSMAQIEAMYFAAQDNKFFEMMEAQFARQRQDGIGIDELGEIAAEIGLDGELMKTRLRSGLYRSIIIRQRETGVEAGIRSVPAVMINGRYVKTKTAECIGSLIEAAAG